MKIRQFAESKNIPLVKLKKLCLELLGAIPTVLTDEQITLIDNHLLSAAKSLSPSIEGNTEDNEGAIAHTTTPSEIDKKVTQIVGVITLKNLLIEYLTATKNHLEAEKFQADSLIFQTEQAFYSDLAKHQKESQQESLARMRKTSFLWSSEKLKEDNNPDDLDVNKELLQLMETFGI